MCEGKREQGEGESKEEREAERVCGVCVCVCVAAVTSGWTVHTAPAYTVLKSLPTFPGEALPGALGNSLLSLALKPGWILSV